jgi:hypothetical protein
MNNIQIHCQHCDTPTTIKNGFIGMRCMCDDETRYYKLEEYLKYGYFTDKLYSMFSSEFTFFDKNENDLQTCE